MDKLSGVDMDKLSGVELFEIYSLSATLRMGVEIYKRDKKNRK